MMEEHSQVYASSSLFMHEYKYSPVITMKMSELQKKWAPLSNKVYFTKSY